jgi:hypothetical protein
MTGILTRVLLIAAAGGTDPRPWYDHKLFNTLVTLAVGTFIVNWLKTRWEREEKKRDKTLEFLDSTGDRLNHLMSLIFNTLILHNLGDERIEELRLLRRRLFEKRFAVRLGAEALLGSPAFSKKYDILANQLFHLTEMLPHKVAGANEELLLAEVQRYKSQLAGEWPIDPLADASVRHPQVQGDKVLAEMHAWNNMIWHRALELISGPLQKEIG